MTKILETVVTCELGVKQTMSQYAWLPRVCVEAPCCCPLQAPTLPSNQLCRKCEPATCVDITSQQKVEGRLLLSITPHEIYSMG